MNLIELERALRQLRLGGIATVLETRLRQAQTEAMAPIDLISCLVSDELTRRSERLLESQSRFRPGHLCLRRPAGRRPVSRPGRHGQESLGTGHRPSRDSAGLPRDIPRNTRAAR